MHYKLLNPEQYVLVCSKQWKGRKLNEIIKNEKIIDYNPSDQMTYDYLRQYNLFHLAQHGRHFVNRTEFLAALVAATLGYTTLAKEFAKPYVENGQLMMLNAGQTYDVQFALAWYPRPEPPRYFIAVIEAID
jgi:DNA-binding transcriptional LysR family regulator